MPPEPQTQPPSLSQPLVSQDPGRVEQHRGSSWTTPSTPEMDGLPWCCPTVTSPE